LFPLYLYPETDKRDLFSDLPENGTRKPNIAEKVYNLLRVKLNRRDITPEDIFYYIYAVLYSNVYREKYNGFLRIDFPRIPFTSDYDLFIQLGKLGEQLAAIHLMKSPELDHTFSKFEISGDAVVKKVTYIQKEKKVYINHTQYFSSIDKEIWEYHIGGYQVMAKWLKDRKKHPLSLEDIRHYIKIARALQLTLQYQDKIDKLYPGVEKNLIQL
jgi:predicted helicase